MLPSSSSTDIGIFLSRNQIDIPPIEIDLGAAKNVLRDIVQTDQGVQPSMQRFLEKYSGAQIRAAMILTTAELILRDPSKNELFPLTRKFEGDRQLSLMFHNDSLKTICLEMYSGSKSDDVLIRSKFPYLPSYGLSDADYKDYEHGEYKKNASVLFDRTIEGPMQVRDDLRYVSHPKPVSEDEYQDIFLGLRWQALNILTWDLPGIRMPKDLPQIGSISSTPNSQKMNELAAPFREIEQ
jgi:hypothetical protein